MDTKKRRRVNICRIVLLKLDDSPFVSEIFVKHADEDSDKGDALGGFLCTGSRSDGTFLHAFCSLQPDGILAKDFSVK